jgi:adenylosuccinate synthase
VAKQKNFELVEYYRSDPVDPDGLVAQCVEWGRQLGPYVDHTERILEQALRDGKNVLFEGAQGTFLDIDHGTYPYVTSSNCVAGSVCAGAGIGPTRIDRVLGITKAYTTRVGGGPFPTEDTGEFGEQLRQAGAEFGATTGRPRRCGWLDAVMLREAATVNGFTQLAINKLDVLSGLPELEIATAYHRDRAGRARLREAPWMGGGPHGLPPLRGSAPERPELHRAGRGPRRCAGRAALGGPGPRRDHLPYRALPAGLAARRSPEAQVAG